ncbi:MAG: hypothetical protein WC566_08160 [Dehalococcoidia bacterium]
MPKENKGKLGYGDIWTFIAIDADTKLVVGWYLGWREPEDAYEFAKDIRSRLDNRVQLTTDGHRMYYQAVDAAFGDDVDYAMLVKHYGNEYDENDRLVGYPKCIRTETKKVHGKPDMSKVSTSYIERQNLTLRMQNRRFTRLTNGFSKKLENHKYALALHFMYYNYCKVHKSLADPYPRTPAMASGVTDHIWSAEEIVKRIPK